MIVVTTLVISAALFLLMIATLVLNAFGIPVHVSVGAP
jgi:hypothetical protein